MNVASKLGNFTAAHFLSQLETKYSQMAKSSVTFLEKLFPSAYGTKGIYCSALSRGRLYSCIINPIY